VGGSSEKSKKKATGQYSFFQRLLALLAGTDDEELLRKRQLKQIAAELSRQKYRFYKPRTGQALGTLCKFFYEVYKVTGPAQAGLQGSENSKALKTILIELFHTEEQQAARERFTDEAIREAAGKVSTDQLAADVRDAMSLYLDGFGPATVTQINDTYTLIHQISDFVRFDFYVVLRKFDSGLIEGSFSRPPRSDSIKAEYVSDDLKDFLEVLMPLDFAANWDKALEALSRYRSSEVLTPGSWKKLVAMLGAVARSGVLIQMVRHVDEDPEYTPIARRESHSIVESHLSALKAHVEAQVQGLMQEVRGREIDQMATVVFGSTFVERMVSYSAKANEDFTRRRISGFAHTDAMNYLAAFVLNYFMMDVRLLISEFFLVRAQWTDISISKQLSEAYTEVLSAGEAIQEFDLAVSDGGELGAKIRQALLPKKQSESLVARKLRETIQETDARALRLIRDTSANLIAVARTVKMLIADREKKTPEFIINWRELESFSTEPLKEQLVQIYKKIYHFIQLIQVCMKS
jgi:hypothetical protein